MFESSQQQVPNRGRKPNQAKLVLAQIKAIAKADSKQTGVPLHECLQSLADSYRQMLKDEGVKFER